MFSSTLLYLLVSVAIAAPWVDQGLRGVAPNQWKWWDNTDFPHIHISDRANGHTHASYDHAHPEFGNHHYHYGVLRIRGAAGKGPEVVDVLAPDKDSNGKNPRELLQQAWESFKEQEPDRASGEPHALAVHTDYGSDYDQRSYYYANEGMYRIYHTPYPMLCTYANLQILRKNASRETEIRPGYGWECALCPMISIEYAFLTKLLLPLCIPCVFVYTL